tara:strand:+ start:1125 stop:1463 length:339 start_codon:yes stop_codon:yes gene_type:complete
MNTYTSADLEAFDCISGFETVTEQCQFLYKLTEGEKGWLEWIGDRYAIAEVLGNTWSEGDDGTVTITIDTMEVSEALAADGVDRAPCLSEDTQLARLVWFIGPDEDYEGGEQ